MTKKQDLKKQDVDFDEDFDLDDLDFSDEVGHCHHEDEAMTEMLANLVHASNHQISTALDLTKLIIKKDTQGDINAEKVLEAFKQSMQAVTETFPLKQLWEKLG